MTDTELLPDDAEHRALLDRLPKDPTELVSNEHRVAIASALEELERVRRETQAAADQLRLP